MKIIEVQVTRTSWLAVEHPQQAKRWHRLLGYETDDYIWIGNEFSRFRVSARDIMNVRARELKPMRRP